MKQESFLRAKYEVEGLSPKQIADLTFSSRSTVVTWTCLERTGINLRQKDRFVGKANGLRAQGLSFAKIAAVVNTMGVRTKTGRAKWSAKTIRDIILR